MRRLPAKSSLLQALPAIALLLFLAMMGGWNLLSPHRDFSEVENRPLAGFPALSAEQISTGQWMSGFETYASDQFPGRDGWMEFYTVLTRLSLKQDNGSVWFGDDGWLFSMEEPDDEGLADNLEAVSHWIGQSSQSHPDVRFSVLLAPTAHSVMKEELPAHALSGDPEGEALTQARQFLMKEAPQAAVPELLRAMRAAAQSGPKADFPDVPQDFQSAGQASDSPLYYRTDHHWTTEGAYAAYCQWAESAGLTPVPASEFQRLAVSHDFYGTTWSKAPDPLMAGDTITCWTPLSQPQYQVTVWTDFAHPEAVEQRSSLYDEAALRQKDQYAYFLGGNDPQLLIRTPVHNGKKLLLVKDSYANSMVPFLALHYEEILITDLRYSHGTLLNEGRPPEEDGASSLPVTDVMLLYNIQSFSEDRNLAWLAQLQW